MTPNFPLAIFPSLSIKSNIKHPIPSSNFAAIYSLISCISKLISKLISPDYFITAQMPRYVCNCLTI